MNIRKSILSLLALAALCMAASATAQTEDAPLRQTEIESMRLKVENDGDNAYFIFSESVVLRATNLVLECDQLEVFAERQTDTSGDLGKYGAIKEVVATGHVRITQEQRVATCGKAVVLPRDERIVLSGNPVVEQPGGRITMENPGDEIILNRGNGRIEFNTTGTRKLRLTGPPIRDLGFEQTAPVPTESPKDEAPAEDANPDEAPKPEPQAPAAPAPEAKKPEGAK